MSRNSLVLDDYTSHSLITIFLSSNRNNQLPARGGAGTGLTSGGKWVQSEPTTKLQVPPRPTSRRGTCSYTSRRPMVRLITHSTHTYNACTADEVTSLHVAI